MRKKTESKAEIQRGYRLHSIGGALMVISVTLIVVMVIMDALTLISKDSVGVIFVLAAPLGVLGFMLICTGEARVIKAIERRN